MRALIAIGMVIVFISAFFILMTGSRIAEKAFSCTPMEGGYNCTYTGVGPTEMFGFAIIFFFIVVDAIALFMIVGALRQSASGKAL